MAISAEIRTEIKGLKETQKYMEGVLRDLQGAPMLNAMRDATLMVERDAKKLAPVDTGRLRSSITPEVTKSVFGNEIVGIVGSNVKYAPYMELGTRPHFPPVFVMAEWVQRKRLAGVYSVKSHRRLGSRTTKAVQDIELAYNICLAISRRGTKGKRFLQGAFEKNKDRIIKRFERAVDASVK